MIILRIDDVGRLSHDPPEKGSDPDLIYFEQWRSEAGLVNLPVVYAATPLWIHERGLHLLSNLQGEELSAVHGYTHDRGVQPTLTEMKRAGFLFRSLCYVPPFNDYTLETVNNWGLAGGKYFLGGWPGDHHDLGDKPVLTNGVIHLPACPLLYGTACDLLRSGRAVCQRTTGNQPLVLTLHLPWDQNPTPVKELVDAIKPLLVSPHYAARWLKENPSV